MFSIKANHDSQNKHLFISIRKTNKKQWQQQKCYSIYQLLLLLLKQYVEIYLSYLKVRVFIKREQPKYNRFIDLKSNPLWLQTLLLKSKTYFQIIPTGFLGLFGISGGSSVRASHRNDPFSTCCGLPQIDHSRSHGLMVEWMAGCTNNNNQQAIKTPGSELYWYRVSLKGGLTSKFARQSLNDGY